MSETLARIGDKWTALVVGELSHGTLRYRELLRSLDGISERMLTLTLKGLEEDGLVRRTLHPSVPPRVDYELTDLGRTLIEPLKALHEWTVAHQPAVHEARKAYARAREEELRRSATSEEDAANGVR